mmetsp:Transcript_8254/g.29342  ORF Transcript_8254/g.29342 Transcript_8254/m.29342 type:complete len:486 (+) Transcript_8254:1372-2829(+)
MSSCSTEHNSITAWERDYGCVVFTSQSATTFCSPPGNRCIGASPDVDSDPRVSSTVYCTLCHLHTVFDMCRQKESIPFQGAYLRLFPFLGKQCFWCAYPAGCGSHPLVQQPKVFVVPVLLPDFQIRRWHLFALVFGFHVLFLLQHFRKGGETHFLAPSIASDTGTGKHSPSQSTFQALCDAFTVPPSRQELLSTQVDTNEVPLPLLESRFPTHDSKRAIAPFADGYVQHTVGGQGAYVVFVEVLLELQCRELVRAVLDVSVHHVWLHECAWRSFDAHVERRFVAERVLPLRLFAITVVRKHQLHLPLERVRIHDLVHSAGARFQRGHGGATLCPSEHGAVAMAWVWNKAGAPPLPCNARKMYHKLRKPRKYAWGSGLELSSISARGRDTKSTRRRRRYHMTSMMIRKPTKQEPIVTHMNATWLSSHLFSKFMPKMAPIMATKPNTAVKLVNMTSRPNSSFRLEFKSMLIKSSVSSIFCSRFRRRL